MVIQCTLSGTLNCVWDYVNKIVVASTPTRGITKTSAYLGKQGAEYKVFILYEIDKANFSRAMEYISAQLGPLLDLADILFSIHSYGSHPPYLLLKEVAQC